MEGLETLSEAIIRLTKRGFTENLRALNGFLIVSKTNLQTKPEEYAVEEIVRFEGDTNLEDESVLFALRHKSLGIKGLYATAFGPQIDSDNLEVIQKLGDKRRP